MEEKEKGGSTPKKAEEQEALTKKDYERLDSIYTRIVNANDDLIALIEAISGERGAVTTWYILSTIKESMELGINSIEKILCDEVK